MFSGLCCPLMDIASYWWVFIVKRRLQHILLCQFFVSSFVFKGFQINMLWNGNWFVWESAVLLGVKQIHVYLWHFTICCPVLEVKHPFGSPARVHPQECRPARAVVQQCTATGPLASPMTPKVSRTGPVVQSRCTMRKFVICSETRTCGSTKHLHKAGSTFK